MTPDREAEQRKRAEDDCDFHPDEMLEALDAVAALRGELQSYQTESARDYQMNRPNLEHYIKSFPRHEGAYIARYALALEARVAALGAARDAVLTFGELLAGAPPDR